MEYNGIKDFEMEKGPRTRAVCTKTIDENDVAMIVSLESHWGQVVGLGEPGWMRPYLKPTAEHISECVSMNITVQLQTFQN